MSQEDIRKQVLELMNQKDKIESEIKELTSILTQNGVGMDDPLVDSEGFPINSIDIYQVRNARHRIICLQNDHKTLMQQIESGLQGYYSSSGSSSSTQVTPMDAERPEVTVHKTPFARISTINPGSPAAYAGLDPIDDIVEFGSVNATNFKSVMDIATVVQHSEGIPINVKIQRGERYITLQVIPKRWAGDGLLGCTIIGL